MPIYEYLCGKCGKKTEVIQRVGEAPLKVCPHCGGRLKKMFSAPAIQFKGSGFYITDYARAKEESGKSSKDGEGSSDSSEKSDKSDKSDKSERLERSQKAAKAEKSEKAEKSQKSAKSEKQDKSEKKKKEG